MTEEKKRKQRQKRGGIKKSEREKKYKNKEIATIFVENLKTLHKILTVLQFYLGDSNFFIFFYQLKSIFRNQ